MKPYKAVYILTAVLCLISSMNFAQEKRRIQIEYSGFLDKDEINFPGATIFTRDDSQQVHVVHEGVIMYCDKAVHYGEEDFIEAYGNVRIIQGDTINMTSKYVEYSGKTKLAFASGDVVLTDPTSEITSDTLCFDRVKQQAYYNNKGKVVRDSSGTITSQIGRYYMNIKKYQFVKDVKLVNPEYVMDSERLDFYSESGFAYLYGPSTITGKTTKIYCERGFYDTNNDIGYFIKKSRIDYDNRVVEGDSMYFDRNRNFASASNNIVVTDTLNKSIIKGHYAEVFKDKDSVFITNRALAITVRDNDSIYIHSDTLMITGKPEHRITRAYYNAKIYKSDLSGKADSIHVDEKSGLTQLINLKRFGSSDAFSGQRHPILWNVETQMTGDSIHLIANTITEQLDSLKVFDNAFIISKDTIGNGFNQIKGQKLFGLFEDNALKIIDIIKNAESIYYVRNDDQELVGIDKAKSGSIKIFMKDNEIEEIRRINNIDGDTYPEDEFSENARQFRGFNWREDERPRSVEDLFKDDPPLNLPVIKGLDGYVPQEEFFDEALMERVEASNKSTKEKSKENKAARNIPKTKQLLKKPQKLGVQPKKKKDN